MRLSQDEILFLEKYQDLLDLTSSLTKYNCLRISSILRQLLLDKMPFIDRVNRKWRFKIKYKIYDPPYIHEYLEDPNIIMFSRPNGLCPDEDSDSNYIYEISLKKFLSIKINKLENQFVTIKDVIKYSANVLGGVHRRDPKLNNEDELSLHKLEYFFNINEIPVIMYQLHSLSKITLDALKPLYDHLKRIYDYKF